MRPSHFRVAFLVGVIASGLACGAGLTAADRNAIGEDALSIAACEHIGEACQEEEDADPAATKGSHHCFRKYDDCMRDAGLRALPDGGK